jgi:hypothetical protein
MYGMVCMVCMVCTYGMYGMCGMVWYVWYVWYGMYGVTFIYLLGKLIFRCETRTPVMLTVVTINVTVHV